MTRFVTKAMPLDNIDGMCHIKKLKSSRTCLTGYWDFISTWIVFNSLGWTHTHTHFADKSNCRLVHAWFKNQNIRWQHFRSTSWLGTETVLIVRLHKSKKLCPYPYYVCAYVHTYLAKYIYTYMCATTIKLCMYVLDF